VYTGISQLKSQLEQFLKQQLKMDKGSSP